MTIFYQLPKNILKAFISDTLSFLTEILRSVLQLTICSAKPTHCNIYVQKWCHELYWFWL